MLRTELTSNSRAESLSSCCFLFYKKTKQKVFSQSFCKMSYLSFSDRLASCFTFPRFFMRSRASFADLANSRPPTTIGLPPAIVAPPGVEEEDVPLWKDSVLVVVTLGAVATTMAGSGFPCNRTALD